MRAAVVRAEGLVRRYGEVEVVAGVSIALAAGESVALLGPSGSGKTTLMQMLGLLDRPTAGRVIIEGQDAFALSARARALLRLARVGFVFQQNNLLEHLSALENVALPAWRLTGSERRARRAAALLLERFGLGAHMAKQAARLSVGQAQRVAIARALINRPALLLADEPTGSLDTASRGVVLDALLEGAQGGAGAALLVVTHDPAVAARAGRILHMRDGRLVVDEEERAVVSSHAPDEARAEESNR